MATADGGGLAWLRRSRGDAAAALGEAIEVHRELLARWPELASQYRGALPELTGEEAWRRTLGMDPR